MIGQFLCFLGLHYYGNVIVGEVSPNFEIRYCKRDKCKAHKLFIKMRSKKQKAKIVWLT